MHSSTFLTSIKVECQYRENSLSYRRIAAALASIKIISAERRGRADRKTNQRLSQKKQAADSGRNRQTHDTGDWTTDIAFYRGQKTARWWSVCTTPCTVCTFNACPSEKAFSVVPGTPELRDNEWGRVLFTDESRFSLSSDSHRILIWRERGSRNHPSNIIERDRYGGRGVLVWEASCLVVVQTFTSSTQVQSTGPVIVTRFFFHMCVF
ncbi:hypothetical protein TNCV_4239801 [Trichonephila clavipes]|nr:hypothetical protein TNCV_4239801 [Trichonephila clavipes]